MELMCTISIYIGITEDKKVGQLTDSINMT
jgi:hypothetical protein